MVRRPPRSTRTDTLFPYTTLFRSGLRLECVGLSFRLTQTICPYALAGGGALFTEKWKLSVAGQASILALGLIFGDSAVRWRPIRRGISRDEPYLCAFRLDRKSTRLNSSH